MSKGRGIKSVVVIVLIVLIGAGIVFYKYHFIPKGEIMVMSEADTLAPKEIKIPLLYEIPIDSFEIVEGTIKNNQTLGNLLNEYKLPSGSLQGLLEIPREKFDLRKIRSGNKFTVFLDKDSTKTLRYFVYEHNYVDYNKLCFYDSVWVENGSKDIEIVQRKITGKIESSLWNAMVVAGANPMLANDLSDIYAWSIDFFGLQEGDSFAVVCDEHFVDTNSIGYGKIHGSLFKHANTEFYAVPFEQNGIVSYYDEEGNSLRKAFLKAPLKFSRISSRFSNSRLHPVLKIRRPHHGVDYAAPSGTPVYAIGDGKVIMANRGYNNGGGNVIKIRHNSVYTTAYLHLKGFAEGISSGVYVKQGQLIAYVGTTGLSTGPHLDFRFYKSGHPIDPLKVDAPPVEPIHDTNKHAYDSVLKSTLLMIKQE